MERERPQGAASARGKEPAAPVPMQRDVQSVSQQRGEDPSADIHQLRNDPMAMLDRLDRRITRLILGVALFNGLLVVITGMDCFQLAL